MKKKLMLLCSMLLVVHMAFSQNRLKVSMLSGRDYEKALSDIGHMTVSDNMLRIYASDGLLLAEKHLQYVEKITFDNENTNLCQTKATNIVAYPNPSQDIIFVKGLEQGTIVRLFSSDGRLIETLTALDNIFQIQVSHLTNGIYLLQANTSIIRFVKY